LNLVQSWLLEDPRTIAKRVLHWRKLAQNRVQHFQGLLCAIHELRTANATNQSYGHRQCESVATPVVPPCQKYDSSATDPSGQAVECRNASPLQALACTLAILKINIYKGTSVIAAMRKHSN
jgi:hypothetical protein